MLLWVSGRPELGNAATPVGYAPHLHLLALLTIVVALKSIHLFKKKLFVRVSTANTLLRNRSIYPLSVCVLSKSHVHA